VSFHLFLGLVMMIIVMVMTAVVLVTDRVSSSLERVRRQLSIKS
jgi:hypothetical protein